MATKFDIEKFNVRNFSLWKLNMKTILRKDGCLVAINERPVDFTNDNKWIEMDKNAMANFHLALADKVLSSIEEKKTANEIWDHLTKLYEATSLHNKIFLKRKLYTLRMLESTSVTEHLNTLNTLFSQLTSLRCTIGEQEHVELLLQSLPDSYDQLIINLTNNNVTSLVFNGVAAVVLQEENRRKNKEDRQVNFTSRSVYNDEREINRVWPSSSHKHGRLKSRSKKNLKCYNCGKNGHLKKDCWSLNKNSNPQGNTVNTSDDGDALCCEASITVEGGSVYSCNDHALEIVGVGTIKLKMYDGTIKVVRDVRHVKGLKKNLLSYGLLDNNASKIETRKGIMKVFRGALVVLKGEKIAANLYMLKGETLLEAEASVASCSLDSAMLWHQKLGHIMMKTLKKYQKCNYGAPETNVSAREALEFSSQQEYLNLKIRYEALQKSQRNLLGEDLAPLSSKELESLEKQLDSSLKQIRSTRTQYMLGQLADLRRKEQLLNEANENLKQRLIEIYQIDSLQLNPSAEDVGYGRQSAHHHPHDDGFFQPLECGPTLQIGYPPDSISVVNAGPSVNNYMAGWLP
ncbi:Agamous-like MADS-box protein AGL9-like protein [Hibiscus syriacus]|uniref:Agamous-like MADS-box protein AGL9-like protein n=1 Tax=Hibiscus syriacus TaxID=106335 RepID=A0A6A3A5P0_HIBSY|nr:Agamous-like MADS-box protein AGL9-like protein [Hibiscus syriacus]